MLKPKQYFLTIFADRTTLFWFIDWVDTLRNCAVCYNTVNFIAGLTATPFAWRGLGTNLKLAHFIPQLTSLQHFYLAIRKTHQRSIPLDCVHSSWVIQINL